MQGRPIYFTISKDSSFQKPTHFWPWKCSCNLIFSVLAASVAIILNERLCPPHVHSILLQLRLGATCLKRMSSLESSARPNDSWHQSRLRLDSGKLKKWGQILLFQKNSVMFSNYAEWLHKRIWFWLIEWCYFVQFNERKVCKKCDVDLFGYILQHQPVDDEESRKMLFSS